MSDTNSVVRHEVVVAGPVEKAFDFFTRRFGDIKSKEHNMLGGHIVDRAEDGTECRWARVLVYEPPFRVVFSWDIGPRWQIEADPEMTSEVEVNFEADGPDEVVGSASV